MTRFFNKKQKYALWLASGGKCQICGCDLDPKNWHADHIHPHSKNGETDVINGQALCPNCNLSKGDKVMNDLRTWQADMVARWSASDKKWFAIVATPGAGKTRAMLHVANEMIVTDRTDIVIIVCPTEHLKKQWQQNALDHYGLELKANFNHHYLSNDYNGVVMTYQQLAKLGQEFVRALHANKRVFVIFDEPHHMADGKAWGQGALYGFAYSEGGILGSGTFFRSDDFPIPFVEYDENNVLKVDYDYGYGKALSDSVVRAIYFRRCDSEASWYSYTDEVVTATFGDELNERQQSERLNASIAPNSKFVQDVLRQAYKELLLIREEEQPDAKMLIICKDVKHAKAIGKAFKRLNNYEPVIVTSDEEHGGSDEIKNFANNPSQQVIISVDMISEGVDIPPLRSLVYLTNKTAPLYFAQAIGRVVRVQPNYEEVNGYVYMPADSRLVAQALEIKKQRQHILKERMEKEKRERATSDAPKPSLFMPIDATYIEGGGVYDGMDFSHGEESEALLLKQIHGFRSPAEEIMKMKRLFEGQQAQATAQEKTSSRLPIEQFEIALGKKVSKRAFYLSTLLNVHVKEIHSTWVYNHNGKWKNEADIDDLKRKLEWINAEIEKLQ